MNEDSHSYATNETLFTSQAVELPLLREISSKFEHVQCAGVDEMAEAEFTFTENISSEDQTHSNRYAIVKTWFPRHKMPKSLQSGKSDQTTQEQIVTEC